jgi:phage-related protein
VTWIIERYERDNGESPVEDFINGLPTKGRAKVWAALTYLEEAGNQAVAPVSKPLGQGLFEVRVGSGRYEVRILYGFRPGHRIVLLHGFLKKAQAIPARELDIARSRLRQLREES